ncbi:MAG: transposase, partial [Proteobacteria bacterium]|nr:transposase [Pseudomonadota bacterium]
TAVRSPRRISKQGNANLRAALFMPALAAIRKDPNVNAFYNALLARGKRKMQAIIAVMRIWVRFAMRYFDTSFSTWCAVPCSAIMSRYSPLLSRETGPLCRFNLTVSVRSSTDYHNSAAGCSGRYSAIVVPAPGVRLIFRSPPHSLMNS